MILTTTHLSPLLSQRLEVIVAAVVICALIFELVRRKRLMERYAILWLLAGVTILVLGIWKGLLTKISHAIGIAYPPSARPRFGARAVPRSIRSPLRRRTPGWRPAPPSRTP